MIFKSEKWELDTQKITVTNLESGELSAFHEEYVRYHLHYRDEHSPELLQKAVDEGIIQQYLEDLVVAVKDKLSEQAEIWCNEDKSFQIANESGNLLEVCRIANMYREQARDSVYAAIMILMISAAAMSVIIYRKHRNVK